jgi:hypothetical protein
MRPISLAQVRERAKLNGLKATEKDVAAAFGESRIERKFRKNGSYSWRVKLNQNDGHGKVTADGHKMRELMTPWARADTERVAKVQGFPGAYSGRGKGKCIMRTFGNKLYRQVQGQWVPA